MAISQAMPIYKDQDFYVPYFEVKIEGRPQGQDVIKDILSVSYTDNITEFDSFDITINNWDAEKRDFKYSDSQLFDPGKKIELWMGYYGKSKLRMMLKGEITSLRPAFPSGAPSTLVISGLNGYRTDGKTMPASFEEQGEQIWQHLGTILRAAAMDYSDLVSVRTYLAAPEYRAANTALRMKYLGGHQPSLTVVCCQLLEPEWKLEVEAMAAK